MDSLNMVDHFPKHGWSLSSCVRMFHPEKNRIIPMNIPNSGWALNEYYNHTWATEFICDLDHDVWI